MFNPFNRQRGNNPQQEQGYQEQGYQEQGERRSLADALVDAANEGDKPVSRTREVDLLGEGDVDDAFDPSVTGRSPDSRTREGMPQPTPQPTPQQQHYTAPAQAPAQAMPNVFIPQDYKSPTSIRQEQSALRNEAGMIRDRLRTVQAKNAEQNAYAIRGANGEYELDTMRYEGDKLELSRVEDQIRELEWQREDSNRRSGEISTQVYNAARQFFESRMGQTNLARKYQEATARAFGENIDKLVNGGFLMTRENLSPNTLLATFNSVFDASLGSAVRTVGIGTDAQSRPNRGTGQIPTGANEDDDPDAGAGQPVDDMADWPDESRRMFEAFERSEETRDGVLADKMRERAKKEKERALQRQRDGRSAS